MRSYRTIILIFLMIGIKVSAQNKESELEEYIELNRQETRLNDYKDSDATIELKLKQLAIINGSRKKYKAPPVKLDILASRVANQMAKDAAKNGYSGHLNLKGELPFMRYALNGGTDHVVENAAASMSSESFNATDENILEEMEKHHKAFMAEKAPRDGHKKTCIGKNFNYVGIGIGWDKGQFRYYEEYIERYLEFGTFQREVEAGKEVTIKVKPIDSKYHVYYAMAYYMEFPQKMTAKQVSAKGSYNDFTTQTALDLAPWELQEKDAEGFTQIVVPTKKKGYYYLHVYLDTKPYKDGKATTAGKIIGSGIVIEAR